MASWSDVAWYTTVQGDTFDIIAYDLFGDEFLASDIITLNPQHSGVLFFGAGVELAVPVYDEDTGEETVAPWRRSQ